MGTKLLLGFGGTVNQAVVHLKAKVEPVRDGIGGTVNQAVVHRLMLFPVCVDGFGGTVN